MNAVGTVLLIEDNPGDVRLVRDNLDQRFGAGVALHAAGTLDHGLRWLPGQAADVILLDLSLPDSHGFTLGPAAGDGAP